MEYERRVFRENREIILRAVRSTAPSPEPAQRSLQLQSELDSAMTGRRTIKLHFEEPMAAGPALYWRWGHNLMDSRLD